MGIFVLNTNILHNGAISKNFSFRFEPRFEQVRSGGLKTSNKQYFPSSSQTYEKFYNAKNFQNQKTLLPINFLFKRLSSIKSLQSSPKHESSKTFGDVIPTAIFSSKFGSPSKQYKRLISSTTLPLSSILDGNNKINTKNFKRRATDSGGGTPSKFKIISIEKKELLNCFKCKSMKEPHLLINCETCNFYYHIGCLDPPLEKMPVKNKFSRFECSDCAEKRMEAEEAALEIKIEETLEECPLAVGRSRRKPRTKLF